MLPTAAARKWYLRRASLWLAGLGVAAASASAQVVVEVESPLTCTWCRGIGSQVAVSLGSVTDPLNPGRLSTVAFDGTVFVVTQPEGAPDELLIYDAAGRYLGARGRGGDGPGEFRGVFAIDHANGHWHVVSMGRVQWFDAEWNEVRSRPTPFSPYGMLALSDTLTLVNAWIGTPQLAGLPLHLIGPGGRLASFGDLHGRAMLELAELRRLIRKCGRAGGGGAWCARLVESRIERYSESGALLERWEIRAPWFEAKPAANDIFLEKPGANVAGVWDGGDGLLWVATNEAADDWRRSVIPQDRYMAMGGAQFKTRIEAYSMTARELVARGYVSGFTMGFLPDGRLVRQRVGEFDEFILDIIEAQIDRRAP